MKNTLIKTLCLLLLLLSLTGCSQRRFDVVGTMAADPVWERLDCTTPLPAMAWVRGRNRIVRIYIEGDGVAYATRTRPSPDPTPITPTALLLARKDDAPAVAYLGRPCQYVGGSACTSVCWTTGRFSKGVLRTENHLVDMIKASVGAERVVLVGFSGGGAVAALLAEQRTDVAALVTVCGTLDHAAWTAMHGVTPLHGSLNPADRAALLARLPQVHLLGEADTNVTRRVTDSFLSRLGSDAPATVRVLPGLAHGGEAWARAWPELLLGMHLPR